MERRTLRILGLALLGMLATTMAALAVIRWQEKITNTAAIKGYGVELWKIDGTAVRITAIPWGALDQGINETTEQVFSITNQLKVKNVGDYDCFFGWKLNSTLPAGVTVTCDYKNGDWLPLAESTGFYGKYAAPIPVGDYSVPVRWTLAVSPDAPRNASFTFDILLLAATTISG